MNFYFTFPLRFIQYLKTRPKNQLKCATENVLTPSCTLPLSIPDVACPRLYYQLFSFMFPPLFAANVYIFKGNFALTEKALDLQEITCSTFEGLQLKITLCYYHEILHQPNQFSRVWKYVRNLQNNDYLPRYHCFYEHYWS